MNHQISETAIVNNCKIDKGTKIWHYSHICKGAKIGKNCNIGQNVFIAGGAVLGDNCKVQNNVSIYEGIECYDNVFIGPSVVFTNVINPRSFIERKLEFKQTILHQGSSIGANATIICGNIIGKHSFIAAGAVVTTNVDDFDLSQEDIGKLKHMIQMVLGSHNSQQNGNNSFYR